MSDEYEMDVANDADELIDDRPSKRSRRQGDSGEGGGRGADGYYLDSKYQQRALNWALFINTMGFAVFVVAASLLTSDMGMKSHFTVNYMLEGDVTTNGNTYRAVNIAAWATITGTILGFICWVLLVVRRGKKETTTHAYFATSVSMFNFWSYMPVAVLETLITLALMQRVGLSHLWTLIYSGVALAAAEFILCTTRIAREETTESQIRGDPNDKDYKAAGTTGFSILVYMVCKLVPYCLMSVAVSHYWPGAIVGAAFIVSFVWIGLRVLFTSLVMLHGIWFSGINGKGWFRWIILRPKGSDTDHHAAKLRKFIQYTSGFGKWPRRVMWVGVVICMIGFILVTVQTNKPFGDGDRGGLHVYERITSVIYIDEGLTAKPQFDRTWEMGRVFLPLIFGLPFIMIIFLGIYQYRHDYAPIESVTIEGYTGYRRAFSSWLEDAWHNARDPYNAFVFSVIRGFIVWMLLSTLGTTEYTELFMAMALQHLSGMMWAEMRKNGSHYYALLAVGSCLLPFVHATVNYSYEAVQSNVELAALIVLFAIFGAHEIITYVLYTDNFLARSKYYAEYDRDGKPANAMAQLVEWGIYTGDEGRKGRDAQVRSFHPDRVVAVRYVGNIVLVLTSVTMLYWLGAMHRANEISNPL